MSHEDIHFNPFVRGMDKAETRQRRQCPAQTDIGSSAALDRDQQTHAEKCQSIDEVDRNDVWDAENHSVPRSAFAGWCSLLSPQPAAARSTEPVSSLGTGPAFVAVGLPIFWFFAFMLAALARLAFRGLCGSPVGKQGNADQRQPKPADDPGQIRNGDP